MYPNGYFAPRYFAPRYFPPVLDVDVVDIVQTPGGGIVAGVDDLHLEYKKIREGKILREEEEIIEIVSIIVASGILEE